MPDKVLVIGAHTDDIEMMCGGTIVKLIELGAEISYATFSFADKSLPKGFPDGTTRQEVGASTKVLGINLLNLYLYDHEVRIFPSIRQEILEELIILRQEIMPDVVITHNSNDTHQDHKVVSEETYRAFKQTSTIWGYESFKNDRGFNNDVYVTLNSDHIEKKIQAISEFKSQIIKYDNREAIKGLAQYRGTQVNAKYAECFELLRMIV